MEQTTSLRTKIFESSLRWNIEHFLDYGPCHIDKLQSQEIVFNDTNASWYLEIWPKFSADYSAPTVKIALILDDNEPSGNRLFKAEIALDTDGHHLASPANRHIVKSKGFYAEPDVIKTPTWVIDYQPNLQKSYENDDFLEHNSVANYLNGGTLTINAKVCIKTVEIVNDMRKNSISN